MYARNDVSNGKTTLPTMHPSPTESDDDIVLCVLRAVAQVHD